MKRLIGCFLLSALSIFLSANTLEEIQNSKLIRIGVDPDIPPFSRFVDGRFEGFEVEFAKKLGNAILNNDGEVKLIAVNAKDRISALENNKVDIIINGFTKTPERAEKVDFAMPYFSVSIGVLVNKGSKIKDIKDLKDMVVAVETGTTAEKFLDEKKYIKLSYTATSNEAYKQLKLGKVDAYASDNIIVMAYPVFDDEVEVPVALRNLGVSDYLAPAVSKGNKELKAEINKYMIEFSKEEFFRKIYDQLFAPFYRNTIDSNQFLLEELYRIYA